MLAVDAGYERIEQMLKAVGGSGNWRCLSSGENCVSNSDLRGSL